MTRTGTNHRDQKWPGLGPVPVPVLIPRRSLQMASKVKSDYYFCNTILYFLSVTKVYINLNLCDKMCPKISLALQTPVNSLSSKAQCTSRPRRSLRGAKFLGQASHRCCCRVGGPAKVTQPESGLSWGSFLNLVLVWTGCCKISIKISTPVGDFF